MLLQQLLLFKVVVIQMVAILDQALEGVVAVVVLVVLDLMVQVIIIVLL